MKFLLYCILKYKRGEGPNPTELGIGGCPVFIIDFDGLGAAVSLHSEGTASTDPTTLMSYHRVIESLNNQITVIPLRFGTLVSREEDVLRLLKNRYDRYVDTLDELHGCVEMGLRIILNVNSLIPEIESAQKWSGMKTSGPGASYLATKQSKYKDDLESLRFKTELEEPIHAQFRGLFTKSRSEVSKLKQHDSQSAAALLSLYYLVPRSSVEPFRQAYDLLPKERIQIMLSGPWPPYNFVLPEDALKKQPPF